MMSSFVPTESQTKDCSNIETGSTFSNGNIKLNKFNIGKSGNITYIFTDKCNELAKVNERALYAFTEVKNYTATYFLTDNLDHISIFSNKIKIETMSKLNNYIDSIIVLQKKNKDDSTILLIIEYNNIDYTSNSIKELHYNSSHYNIDCVFIENTPNIPSVSCKAQVDTIIFGKLYSDASMNQRMYNSFFGANNCTYRQYIEIMKQLCETSFLVIHRTELYYLSKDFDSHKYETPIVCSNLENTKAIYEKDEIINKIYKMEETIQKLTKMCLELKLTIK